MEIEGKYAKYAHGASKIEAIVEDYAVGTFIEINCNGINNSFSPGYILEVPKEGLLNWEKGAIVGLQYAIKKTKVDGIKVVISKISGLVTDTNPTIVALAAADIVFQYTHYKLSDEEIKEHNMIAKESWKKVPDYVPTELELKP